MAEHKEYDNILSHIDDLSISEISWKKSDTINQNYKYMVSEVRAPPLSIYLSYILTHVK